MIEVSKEIVDQWKSERDALEADRDQISLTLAVAKADRDKWFNRAKALEAALRWSLRRTLPKDNAEEALFQQYRELANYPAETPVERKRPLDRSDVFGVMPTERAEPKTGAKG